MKRGAKRRVSYLLEFNIFEWSTSEHLIIRLYNDTLLTYPPTKKNCEAQWLQEINKWRLKLRKTIAQNYTQSNFCKFSCFHAAFGNFPLFSGLFIFSTLIPDWIQYNEYNISLPNEVYVQIFFTPFYHGDQLRRGHFVAEGTSHLCWHKAS